MSRGTEKRGCLVLRFWWVEVGCLLGDAIGRCILSLGVKSGYRVQFCLPMDPF